MVDNLSDIYDIAHGPRVFYGSDRAVRQRSPHSDMMTERVRVRLRTPLGIPNTYVQFVREQVRVWSVSLGRLDHVGYRAETGDWAN